MPKPVPSIEIPRPVVSPERAEPLNWCGPFNGRSEMAERMRQFDWSKTELGPVETWSHALRSAVSLCVGSRLCKCIYWGEHHLVLYNDAYSSILGTKHSWALAQKAETVWSEVFDYVGPLMKKTLNTGLTTGGDDAPIFVNRAGYVEECYFSFSYTSILNEHGQIEGVFATLPETSVRVIGERRLQTLQRLGWSTGTARTPEETLAIVAKVIADNPYDIPFASFYLWGQDEGQARLCAVSNIEEGLPLSPPVIRFGERSMLARLVAGGGAATLRFFDVKNDMRPVPTGGWGLEPLQLAVLLFSVVGVDSPKGLMLAGVSPHKRLDENYVDFFRMISDQIARALTEAFAHAQEDESIKALQARARVVQQEERLRIARDLHDTLLQSVQGMRFLIEAGLDKYRAGDPTAVVLFDRALAASIHAIAEGREVLSLLRSPVVASDDLCASLAHLLQEVVADTRIRCVVHQRGRERRINPRIWPEVSAICREAVANTIRHARASVVEINVTFGERLRIDVTDDGCGVNDATHRKDKPGHYGLRGMRERAAGIHGDLSVARRSAGGTVVRLTVPGALAYAGSCGD